MIKLQYTDQFEKDLKKLYKNYKSLYDDLRTFSEALMALGPTNLPNTVRIPIGQEYTEDPVYKVRNFRCQSLKGKGARSGIRVVFAHDPSTENVTLVEIYFKTKKTNHSIGKITKYLNNRDDEIHDFSELKEE